MKRTAVVPAAVLVATAVGAGVVLGYRPDSSGNAALPATVKVGATAGVGAGTSAVGTDQSISGGLGDIQVRVSARNGKITTGGTNAALGSGNGNGDVVGGPGGGGDNGGGD